ncbi:hypothetical protein C8F04DRAFT_1145545 [Mycena alexandri]|uniref:F-box domain-containing protein n=1 Tax=Mycena alexandri TaxID=1745969 RepID=A0AAD6WP46_9AGAR|nr:hypothetical protein C8F04DRAFT_1145545 [Mycena alexandri]
MPSIPQELINAIVSHLPMASLKTCSLVDPTLRGPCQRILLRSISLKCWLSSWPEPPNLDAALGLLEESPHVAPYITHLTIRLQLPICAHLSALQLILRKLDNVTWCMVDGYYRRLEWSSLLTFGLSAALAEFLGRESLRTLHLRRIRGFPAAIFRRTAPRLSLEDVEIAESVQDPIVPPGRAIDDLALGRGTDDLYPLLASSQFHSQTASLRRLSISPHNDKCVALILSVAASLQELQFQDKGLESRSTLMLPPLPALKSIEFLIGFPGRRTHPVLDTINSILTSGTSPNLENITLSFSWYGLTHSPSPDAKSLAALDSALASHPNAPAIHWRMNFRLMDFESAKQLSELAERVRREMWNAKKMERLVVEEYQE